ncbi:hypothetical protein HY989_01990 [Candidatus Micrarchaeota archaeon]|nr:hypothetical protein [Candidatus Micrarchaeota archaeon]
MAKEEKREENPNKLPNLSHEELVQRINTMEKRYMKRPELLAAFKSIRKMTIDGNHSLEELTNALKKRTNELNNETAKLINRETGTDPLLPQHVAHEHIKTVFNDMFIASALKSKQSKALPALNQIRRNLKKGTIRSGRRK